MFKIGDLVTASECRIKNAQDCCQGCVKDLLQIAEIIKQDKDNPEYFWCQYVLPRARASKPKLLLNARDLRKISE